MKKVSICVGILLIVLVGSLAQAAPSKDIKATLNVYNWGNIEEAAAYERAINRFNEKYPNVEVVNNMTPVASWSDYVDKWLVQITGGSAPDVINIAIEGLSLAVSKKLLIPLNNYINEEEEARDLLAQIPPKLIDALTVDGDKYLIPNGWQTMVIYYNTKIFKEKGIESPKPDWTWDDFLEKAQKLTDGNIYGFGLAFGFFHLHPWFITNDAYPVTKDYQHSNLIDPKMIEAVTFVSDLVNKYKVSPDPIGVDVYSQFAAEKVAMVGAGRWPLNGWSKSGFSNYASVPWPCKRKTGTVFGGAGWGISPQCKNTDLAWELIKELISRETMADVMEIGQQIPILEDLYKAPQYADLPSREMLLWDVLENAEPVAAPSFFRDLEQITMRHLELVVSKLETPEEGLKAAHQELEAEIE